MYQMTDWSRQRLWRDVRVGEPLGPVAFPLSLYRLVLAAAATRDFNPIHHNSEYARATGAPEAYANTMFLQGMWERVAREFIGLEGRLLAMRDFRMRRFAPAGVTVVVRGSVRRKWIEGPAGLVEIELCSEVEGSVTCGPGSVLATVPTGQ